jgi:hypothetical protein
MRSNIKSFLETYYRLAVLIAVCVLLALAQASPMIGFADAVMAYFLVLSSMTQLQNLEGFAAGFKKYDLLSKRFPGFENLFPYLQLVLGIMLLSSTLPFIAHLLTSVLVISVGLGVLKALARGEKLSCVCIGSDVNLPIGPVTVLENLSMLTLNLFGMASMLGLGITAPFVMTALAWGYSAVSYSASRQKASKDSEASCCAGENPDPDQLFNQNGSLPGTRFVASDVAPALPSCCGTKTEGSRADEKNTPP